MITEQTNAAIERIAALIRANDGFSIIAHTSPDGDALGSTLALYGAIKELGKDAEVVCDYRVPAVYSFLPFKECVVTPDRARGYNNVIAIDCADASRMGDAGRLFVAAKATANIDHHCTNTMYAETNAVDSDAAAAGEIVYELVARLLPDFGRDVATCLYTALMTDTGNFAYSNTAPSTHLTAAALLEKGADNTEINRAVYRSIPFCKQRLLGKALTKAETHFNGLLAYTSVNIDDMVMIGAAEEDTEGIIDYIRDIDTVELAIMVREAGENVYKVSLRSKRAVDVGALAGVFGGGGHVRAAGCTVRKELESLKNELFELSRKALEDSGLWKA